MIIKLIGNPQKKTFQCLCLRSQRTNSREYKKFRDYLMPVENGGIYNCGNI